LTERVEQELGSALSRVEPDIITLSGTGEPTLAANLGDVIDIIRGITDLPIAVLTNSSLLGQEDVRRALYGLDVVVAKLDAPDNDLFKRINGPASGIEFEDIVKGIREFRRVFQGKLALQMMFIKENKDNAEDMASIARDLGPDEVQINTPLRPSPIQPLSRDELHRIEDLFSDMNTVNVFRKKEMRVEVLDQAEVEKRRPDDR